MSPTLLIPTPDQIQVPWGWFQILLTVTFFLHLIAMNCMPGWSIIACLTCHIDFQPSETDEAFNSWTSDRAELFHNRKEDAEALLCTSCHGSPHSLYPAINCYGATLGVIQPLQYQKTPYPIGSDLGCQVCHTVEMEDEMHHPGSLSTFRNREQ